MFTKIQRYTDRQKEIQKLGTDIYHISPIWECLTAEAKEREKDRKREREREINKSVFFLLYLRDSKEREGYKYTR